VFSTWVSLYLPDTASKAFGLIFNTTKSGFYKTQFVSRLLGDHSGSSSGNYAPSWGRVIHSHWAFIE